MLTANDLLLLEATIEERMRELRTAEQYARLGVPPYRWPRPVAALRRLIAHRRRATTAPTPLAATR